MLAGGLRPSDLQAALGIPPVCLPLSARGSLLESWREAIARTPGCEGAVVAVSGESEARLVRPLAARGGGLVPEVVVDPANWRGMGGILRDLCPRFGAVDVIVGIEANSCPPDSLVPLLQPLQEGADAAVGSDELAAATGCYAIRRSLVEQIRTVGYCDLKEQFLPGLYESGADIRQVCTARVSRRIRDREGYLGAVARLSRSQSEAPVSGLEAAHGAGSLVDPTAVVGRGAVVDRSVILAGAVIDDGAIVSRSIVGVGVAVGGDDPIVGRILATSVPGKNRATPGPNIVRSDAV